MIGDGANMTQHPEAAGVARMEAERQSARNDVAKDEAFAALQARADRLERALRAILRNKPDEQPEVEDYDDMDSAWMNGSEMAWWEAAAIAETALGGGEAPAAEPLTIMVVCDGGLVQEVLCSAPLNGRIHDVIVLDYDTGDDNGNATVKGHNGSEDARASVWHPTIELVRGPDAIWDRIVEDEEDEEDEGDDLVDPATGFAKPFSSWDGPTRDD
jgi:hypothetical protein